ncbi:MAG: EF-hand domain-containing protein [Phenylobacterium sp.]|nr:EF-hand domain-containing protein [Phenylobacterium sp.]
MRAFTAGWALILVCAGLAAPAAARDRFDPVALLAQSDLNRDGSITRAEYVEGRRARFAKMDRDGDGYVSEADLPRLVRKRAGDRLERAIDGLDANRDGRLSRAEFVEGPARLFELADVNRDGRIDRAEQGRLAERIAARRAR